MRALNKGWESIGSVNGQGKVVSPTAKAKRQSEAEMHGLEGKIGKHQETPAAKKRPHKPITQQTLNSILLADVGDAPDRVEACLQGHTP